MRKIISCLGLPTRWARCSGPWIFGFFLQPTIVSPQGWQHDNFDDFFDSPKFVTVTLSFSRLESGFFEDVL